MIHRTLVCWLPALLSLWLAWQWISSSIIVQICRPLDLWNEVCSGREGREKRDTPGEEVEWEKGGWGFGIGVAGGRQLPQPAAGKLFYGYNCEDLVFTRQPGVERFVLSPDNIWHCLLKLLFTMTVKIDGKR